MHIIYVFMHSLWDYIWASELYPYICSHHMLPLEKVKLESFVSQAKCSPTCLSVHVPQAHLTMLVYKLKIHHPATFLTDYSHFCFVHVVHLFTQTNSRHVKAY